jgi:hypothetical protein
MAGPVKKKHWWTGLTEESYWCEITDRSDIGADLRCPQTDERGCHTILHSISSRS